ncbi:hypothetical protein BCR42DRAFT_51622 [Absidia repens]|uniref:Uncharacterized protein n=1 Tax=Absidia repens TaxID=90262 RepID=A0A1X2IF30_9FUNG|nr:hypothetical protein BCR42DRAFT_51622 [Absidia repens]
MLHTTKCVGYSPWLNCAQKLAETSPTIFPNTDTGNLLPSPQSSPSLMQRLDSSQSLAHLPPDTAFMIQERSGSDLLDITPLSTADEWTRSHGSLPHHLRLHTCETMQITGKRPSFMTKLFRSRSTNTTIPQHNSNDDDLIHTLRTSDNNSISVSMGDETSDINRSNTILYRSPTLDASNYPNQIDNGENQDLEDTGLQSGRSAMNQSNNGLVSARQSLSPSRTTTTMTNSSNPTHRPSRFSFVSRRTTRLRSVLSRPPSYKRYDNPEQEEQQARDIAALRRLEQYYENERNTGLLHQLIWAEEGLPQAAKALWIPLALYCVGVLVFFGYHRRRATKIHELEQQIGRARRRRLNELLSNMELPSDHYFVIEDRSTSHAHPVVTLLPPPPDYAPMTRPTMTGSISTPPQYNTEDRNLSPRLQPQQQQQQQQQLASSSPTNSSVPMLEVSPSISYHPCSPPHQQQQQQQQQQMRRGQEQDTDEQDDSMHMWQVSQAEETMELERASHSLYRPL